MAKFVIAGSCDCPYLAKLELLAVQLARNLPQFKLHKIVLPAEKWKDWLSVTCTQNGWNHCKSPIVWRELVERGGKGKLLGGFNEFLEYAQCYYGITSDMMTDLMIKVKDENVVTNAKKIELEEYYKNLSKPIHVCLSNASSPVAYQFMPSLARGDIFGSDVEISIHLLDAEQNREYLKGVKMEILDLAHPLLRNVTIHSEADEAFKDATAVIFLEDETCWDENNSHEDLLLKNAERFKQYAESLNEFALRDVKVIVAGNGAVNFNTHVLIEHATKLNKQNIVAASRLQERRSCALLSRRLNVNSAGVKDVIIWGNCANDSATNCLYIGTSVARVHGYDGAVWGPDWFSRPLVEMVHDNEWLTTDFISSHHEHKSVLEGNLNHTSSMSEAAALSSLLRDWVQGSSSNQMWSLGVKCEGWYGLSDCVFSLPVRFLDGSYKVVWDLELDAETKDKLKKIEIELKKDLKVVFTIDDPEESEVFGENSQLISSMVTPIESPSKTPGEKLEVIEEEEDQPMEEINQDKKEEGEDGEERDKEREEGGKEEDEKESVES